MSTKPAHLMLAIGASGDLLFVALPHAAERRVGATLHASGTAPTISQARPAAPPTHGGAPPVRMIDYNWDVKPILSDYCFRCDGPDERARRAGLRLDQPDSAFARRPGEQIRFAIVAGRPDDSELMRRVTHQNAVMRM